MGILHCNWSLICVCLQFTHVPLLPSLKLLSPCLFCFGSSVISSSWLSSPFLWASSFFRSSLVSSSCHAARNSMKSSSCGSSLRQPTPVLLPGKSHGWRSLEGCSPWGCEELDITERLHFHFSHSCIGEGNGNPLQCSCLKNPRDGGAWWAAVYGVARSRLK